MTATSLGFHFNLITASLIILLSIKQKSLKQFFENCQLHETDFADCDAVGVAFKNCDLLNAKFENTILEKADFRNAFNYSINPELNKMKKAKFSLAGIPGLLHKYNIIIK